jgi:hypothetical protein
VRRRATGKCSTHSLWFVDGRVGLLHVTYRIGWAVLGPGAAARLDNHSECGELSREGPSAPFVCCGPRRFLSQVLLLPSLSRSSLDLRSLIYHRIKEASAGPDFVELPATRVGPVAVRHSTRVSCRIPPTTRWHERGSAFKPRLASIERQKGCGDDENEGQERFQDCDRPHTAARSGKTRYELLREKLSCQSTVTGLDLGAFARVGPMIPRPERSSRVLRSALVGEGRSDPRRSIRRPTESLRPRQRSARSRASGRARS